jgi:hypothetical protein
MKLKAPTFLTSLYRDMRDRRLLIPVAVLLVAIVAVPLVLRKPAEPAPPVAATPAPSADATAVTTAVLVDSNVDVREYQKRLAKLKSKNPFDVRFTVTGQSTGTANSGSGTGGAASDVANPSDPSAGTATGPASPAPTGSGSTSTDVGSGTPTDTTTPDTSGDTTTPDTPVQPEIRFFAGRVDVSVGPLGKAKDLDNVKYLTFLPDDSAPIAAFVGLTGSGRSESAVFAITSQAAVLDGDGTCAPHKPDPCQFLTLKPGEQRYIRYADKTYRLKVRDTHVVEVKDPNDASNQGDNSVTDGTNDGNGNGNGDTGGTQPQA